MNLRRLIRDNGCLDPDTRRALTRRYLSAIGRAHNLPDDTSAIELVRLAHPLTGAYLGRTIAALHRCDNPTADEARHREHDYRDAYHVTRGIGALAAELELDRQADDLAARVRLRRRDGELAANTAVDEPAELDTATAPT